MVRFSMEQHNRGEWIRASNAPALSEYSAWIIEGREELQQGHPSAAPAPVCGSRLYFDACMISHKQYTKIGHTGIFLDKHLKKNVGDTAT